MHPHSPTNHTARPTWATARDTNIGVIGAGEIGLRTAVEFAERGYQVVCADVGASRSVEPANLAADVRRNTRSGRLRFTSSSADAARHGRVIVMAVAPRSFGAGHSDVESLSEAAVEVAQNLSGPAVIVDRATTSEAMADRMARLMARNCNHEIVVVSGSPTLHEQAGIRVFLRSTHAAASFLHRWV